VFLHFINKNLAYVLPVKAITQKTSLVINVYSEYNTHRRLISRFPKEKEAISNKYFHIRQMSVEITELTLNYSKQNLEMEVRLTM
jgi:hypothetical protein